VPPSEPASYSFWGSPRSGPPRRLFFLIEIGTAVVGGAVGLAFNVMGISKENDRQDFIRQHGNVDLRPGPGVQEVGPQCKGTAQCATYAGIKDDRDRDYMGAVVGYSIAGASLLGAGLVIIEAALDRPRDGKDKVGKLQPMFGPNVAGATWQVSF
jgi:hypothetical protein